MYHITISKKVQLLLILQERAIISKLAIMIPQDVDIVNSLP